MVAIRVRPPLMKELREYGDSYQSTLTIHEKSIRITENMAVIGGPNVVDDSLFAQGWAQHEFAFDAILPESSTQADVYEVVSKNVIDGVLQGYNGTIIAYGQTGSGKTFTMEGFDNTVPRQAAEPTDGIDARRGVIPRAIERVFSYIEENEGDRFTVRCSYLQLYNESIFDLLHPQSAGLSIHKDEKQGVVVDGLSVYVTEDPQAVYRLLRRGQDNRVIAATRMNQMSSRSHAIFQLAIERVCSDGCRVFSKLNLVDLAGSERVRDTGARGQRLEEAAKINLSLSTLGAVIAALTQPGAEGRHIPYRRSKLTRLLEDSLGGNSLTAFLAAVSPSPDCYAETLSTLQFAARAKLVKNRVRVNEEMSDADRLRACQEELERLRGADERISELEAQRDMILQQLEERSHAFLEERQAKMALEERLAQIETRINGLSDSAKLRQRVAELMAEQDRSGTPDPVSGRAAAQATRYRELMLRQRDVMIALTHRLTERDEMLIQLQQELESADRARSEVQAHMEAAAATGVQLQELVTRVNETLLNADKRCAPLATTLEQVRGLLADYQEPLIDRNGRVTKAGHSVAAGARDLIELPPSSTVRCGLPPPPGETPGPEAPVQSADVALSPPSVSHAPSDTELSQLHDLEVLNAEQAARVAQLESEMRHTSKETRALHQILEGKLGPALERLAEEDARATPALQLVRATVKALQRTVTRQENVT